MDNNRKEVGQWFLLGLIGPHTTKLIDAGRLKIAPDILQIKRWRRQRCRHQIFIAAIYPGRTDLFERSKKTGAHSIKRFREIHTFAIVFHSLCYPFIP